MRRLASVAGWTRQFLSLSLPFPAGTGSIEPVTDWDLGIHYTVEAASFQVRTAFTGSGATRVLRVLKGASTVVASKTIALADVGTIGTVIALTVVPADANFEPGNLLTVEWDDDGAVAYTAGAGELILTLRSKPQTA
jgi:hypothetical protein